MADRGQAIFWPDNPAPHVTEWWLDIGPSISGDAGERPIEWRDMAAWEHFTGIELDTWEARTIRRLSRVYLSQRYDAKKPDCPPPYSGKKDEIIGQRDKVAALVKGAFLNLNKAPKKKKKRG